jgi:hypothetical protein
LEEKLNLYNELDEIIDSWEKVLTKREKELQFFITKILDEVIKDNTVSVMYFVYEYNIMNLHFWAKDNQGKILLERSNILNISPFIIRTLFPKELLVKQNNVINKYNRTDEKFDEIYRTYEHKKQDIFEKWFKLCWDKVRTRYKDIPKTFFSRFDKNSKILQRDEDEITK